MKKITNWRLIACLVFVMIAASLAFGADVLSRFNKIGLATNQTTGRINIKSGTAATDGIYFGSDTTLYRSAANTLTTNDLFGSAKDAASATAVSDFLYMTNTKNASSMTGTGAGILWNQWYYDEKTPALADAARVSVVTEGNWTSTASTQDATLNIGTALNGTITTQLAITSAGAVTATGLLTGDDVAATDDATVGDDLAVTGLATVGETLGVTGTATFTGAVVANGNVTLGNAYSDTVTSTGQFTLPTLASNPLHETPANRPAGSAGSIGYYSTDLYICVDAATPTWELVGTQGS